MHEGAARPGGLGFRARPRRADWRFEAYAEGEKTWRSGHQAERLKTCGWRVPFGRTRPRIVRSFPAEALVPGRRVFRSTPAGDPRACSRPAHRCKPSTPKIRCPAACTTGDFVTVSKRRTCSCCRRGRCAFGSTTPRFWARRARLGHLDRVAAAYVERRGPRAGRGDRPSRKSALASDGTPLTVVTAPTARSRTRWRAPAARGELGAAHHEHGVATRILLWCASCGQPGGRRRRADVPSVAIEPLVAGSRASHGIRCPPRRVQHSEIRLRQHPAPRDRWATQRAPPPTRPGLWAARLSLGLWEDVISVYRRPRGAEAALKSSRNGRRSLASALACTTTRWYAAYAESRASGHALA